MSSGPANTRPPASPVDLHLRSHRRLAMAGLVLLAVPAVWFVRTDLGFYAGDWPALSARLAVRLALIGVPVAGVLLLRTATDAGEYSRRLFLVSLGAAAALVALCALRPPGSGLPLRSPLFMVAMMYAALPNTRWRQVAPPLLLTAGILLLEATRLQVGMGDLTSDLVILAALNLGGWFIVGRRLGLEAEVESAWHAEHQARTELRTLRGLIPICSHCKNVRTELGEWQRIEHYVRDRSLAEFSHGICPSCLQKHFPGVQPG